MARVYEEIQLTIQANGQESNVLQEETADATELIILPPANLLETVYLYIMVGETWTRYDDMPFIPGEYRRIDAIGVKYKLVSETAVAAYRPFEVNKRVT